MKTISKYIVVGSVALKNHGINGRGSYSSDIDLVTIGTPQYTNSSPKVDYLDNPELYNILLPRCRPIEGTVLLLPDINALYLLKLSHMNQNINWVKHLKDIKDLQPYLHPITEEDKILFNKLYDFWVRFYPLKPIKLNKEPEKFFNMVTPEQHELHHEHFKLGNKPVYTKFLKENHEVMIDMDKFLSLVQEEQINSVWEESMVIAYERKFPLLRGLQKVLCDLSKGEWNKFMIWNLVQIMDKYPDIQPFFVKQVNSLKEQICES